MRLIMFLPELPGLPAREKFYFLAHGSNAPLVSECPRGIILQLYEIIQYYHESGGWFNIFWMKNEIG